MHIIRFVILCGMTFFYQCVGCYAQIGSTHCPVIEIGMVDNPKRISCDSLGDCGLISTMGLCYFQLDAIAIVTDVNNYSNHYLVDVKIDSIINESPKDWTIGVEQLTICLSEKDAETTKVGIAPSDKKVRLKLKSIRSVNYIGHGEEYYLINSNANEGFVKIPFSLVKNNLMQLMEILAP